MLLHVAYVGALAYHVQYRTFSRCQDELPHKTLDTYRLEKKYVLFDFQINSGKQPDLWSNIVDIPHKAPPLMSDKTMHKFSLCHQGDNTFDLRTYKMYLGLPHPYKARTHHLACRSYPTLLHS